MKRVTTTQVTVGLLLLLAAFAGAVFAGTDSRQDMLTAYYAIHKSYAADSTTGVADAATRLATAAESYRKTEKDAGRAAMAKSVSDDATRLKSSADLSKGRDIFKSLSRNVAQLQLSGDKKADTNAFYCPMAKGYWLQADTIVANPYYGKMMSGCGTRVDKIQ